MNFSIPYFRSRRYLNGIDWVVGALHQAGKTATGNGATSQAVIDLAGCLDDQPLRAAIDKIAERFPLIHGQFARDWSNLAPYWKVPRSSKNTSITLKVVDLPSGSMKQSEQLLLEHVNTPMELDNQHLRFLLIRIGSEQSRLGLMFDHRLFDAYGAEVFFRLLDETFHGRFEEVAPRINTTEPAHLDHWKRRFASGKVLNRLMVELQKKDVRALAMPPVGYRRMHLMHDGLTVEETAAVNKKAFKEIGVPILLPSAAARAVVAVQQAVPALPLDGSQYLLFTSANLRPAGDVWPSMFFNHFSFVYFSAPTEPGQSIRDVAVVLRNQFFQHMKDKIPFAVQDAAALGRIFPRWLIGRIINSMFKGRMCSFYFACLKESGFTGETFMGLPVTNLFHTPLAFAPPGMNLCMTFFAGRFNLVLSYVEGALDDSTASKIIEHFKKSLVELEAEALPVSV